MRPRCWIGLVSVCAPLLSCFYHPTGAAAEGAETTTSQTASTTDLETSGGVVATTEALTGTSTTGSETGGSTPDAPPSIRSFTVNSSITPPEVGTPGYVTLAAVAEDDVGLQEVRFFDGDDLLGAVAGPGPYVFEWRVDSAMNGLHKLHAFAVDTSMQSAGSAEIDLNIFMFGGQEVWVDTFPVGEGAAKAVRIDENGDVYAAGESGPDGQQQCWVHKYTPDGDLVWESTPGTPAGWDLEGFAVGAGAIDLAGGQGDPYHAWLWRLDGAGALKWGITDDSVLHFLDIAVSPLGHSIAKGMATGPRIVIKQHSSEGDFMSSIEGPMDSEIGGMAIDASGSIYASMVVGSEDVIVQKYDPAGVLMWTRLVESKAPDAVLVGSLVFNAVHGSLGIVCSTINAEPHFAELSTSGEAMRPIEPVTGWIFTADPSGGWVAVYDNPYGDDAVRRYSHDFTLIWESKTKSETLNDAATDAMGSIYVVGWQSPDKALIRKLVP